MAFGLPAEARWCSRRGWRPGAGRERPWRTIGSVQDIAAPGFREELPDGLVRRWSTAADVEPIAALLGATLRRAEDEMPNPRTVAGTHLVMQSDFPYMSVGDGAVVEDPARDESSIVACIFFWRHTWSFAGIPFGITRPEMVATEPSYRRRGLIRALFEMIHARGASEGHLLSTITGIPYFYRQFGYEYVFDLEGSRTAFFPLIPDRHPEQAEGCDLRVATLDDVERLKAMYDASRGESLVWHEAVPEHWRSEIGLWDDPRVRDADLRTHGADSRYWMIETPDREVVGSIRIASRRRGRALHVDELVFAEDADVEAIAPALMRSLREVGMRTLAIRDDAEECGEIRLSLGASHPLYSLLGDDVAPKREPPYAWLVRVPDLPAFLRHVRPAFEARLERSVLANSRGTLEIDLYRDGLRIVIDRGRLVEIEPWQAPVPEEESTTMGCPPLTFLQLLLGHRSLDELTAIHPDVWVRSERRLLVDTLFPKIPSHVEQLA
jgi:GNAT superfamily N-acetyltransferase